jgi:hypothetical protein
VRLEGPVSESWKPPEQCLIFILMVEFLPVEFLQNEYTNIMLSLQRHLRG